MNANEDMIAYSRYKQIGDENLYLMEKVRQQQAEIEALNQRIERMIENQSHHEGIAHAGGFEQGHEVGRQLGMKQERAMWELARIDTGDNEMTTFTTQDRQDAERTPLSDQELLKMAADKFHYTEYKLAIEFARAIERAHRIGE